MRPSIDFSKLIVKLTHRRDTSRVTSISPTPLCDIPAEQTVSGWKHLKRSRWRFPRRQESFGYWNPIWLDLNVLIPIAMFSFCSAGSILVLLLISQRHQGLSLLVNSHYAWTYGPTSLFIIFTAIWRQVDFYCKALTPWSILQKKEAEASENLLLDHVSPIQLSSLITAVRSKHHSVVAASLGFLTLKTVALASTALFSPGSATTADLIATAPRSAFKTAGNLTSTDTTPGLFEPAIVYEAYAVLAKSLPYQEGISPELLYETIQLPPETKDRNFTLTGTVRAIVPKFQCESAPFDLNFVETNSRSILPEVQIRLAFPECTLGANGEGVPVVSLNPQLFATPPRQLSPLVQRIDCLQQGPNATENWQLLTLVDFRYNQTVEGDRSTIEPGENVQATSWFTNAVQRIGIACRSSYSMEDVNVTYSSISGERPGRISIERLSPGDEDKMDALTDADVGALTTAALSAAAFMFGGFQDNTFAEEYPNTLFKMMASLTDGTYASLLNETLMIEAAQTALQQIALHSLHKHMVSDRRQSVTVVLSYDQIRLLVNPVSAAVMISGTFLVGVFALVLILVRPYNVTKQDPELLSTAAVVLKNSPELQALLEQAGTSGSALQDSLNGALFKMTADTEKLRSGIQVYHQIENQATESEVHVNDGPEADNTRWFQDMTTTKWYVVLSICLPLAMFAGLEALQQVSDKQNGITTVTQPNNQVVKLLPNILSASALLGIAMMIDGLEFNISLMAPLKFLPSEKGDLHGDILTSYLGRTPPMVLVIAFLRQHWTVMFSTSAAFIGTALAIVVSGLYTFDTIGSQTPMPLMRLDTFDITWPGSAFNDSSAAVVNSLSESISLADPAFSYQELAFPQIQLSEPLDSKPGPRYSTEGHLLQTKLPALRASLDCVSLDSSTYNFTTSYNPSILSSRATFSTDFPLPDHCLLGGPNGTASTLEIQTSFGLRSNNSYVGKLLDIHVGPFNDTLAGSTDELAPHTQPDNPPGCPTLAFIYGYANTQNPSETTATALVCTQRINQIQTNVTFTPGNMSISLLHPPITDETTLSTIPGREAQKYIVNGTTYTPYRIQSHFEKTFVSNDQFRADGRNCSFWDADGGREGDLEGSDPPIDHFFQGVMCSPEPWLDVTTLKGGKETDTALVFTSIQAFYRRYIARAVDGNIRRPISNEDRGDGEAEGALPIAVLLNAAPQTRLVQQRQPKITLQVMLLLISVLMGAAVWMIKPWDVLVQENPCCLAGRMGLFVGSAMCTTTSVSVDGGRSVEVRTESCVGGAVGGGGEGQGEMERGEGEGIDEVLPHKAEEMSAEELRSWWREKRWGFRLGLWDGAGPGPGAGGGARAELKRRRWGIDAVKIE